MDKNTTIGLLLIGAIIVVFSIYNRPNQEELAKQRRIRDSLAMVEIEKARAEAEAEKQVDDSVALIQQAETMWPIFLISLFRKWKPKATRWQLSCLPSESW